MRGVGRLRLGSVSARGAGSDSPPFRPRGSSYILRSFPSILIYLPYCIFRNFLFILHLFLFALCREVKARGRGGAHSHAAGRACWQCLNAWLRCLLFKTRHRLLPSLKVFLLSPPLRPLLLSSPPFGGVGGLGAPPFFFLSFSFPFFLPPRGHAVFERVRRAKADSGQPYWLKR